MFVKLCCSRCLFFLFGWTCKHFLVKHFFSIVTFAEYIAVKVYTYTLTITEYTQAFNTQTPKVKKINGMNKETKKLHSLFTQQNDVMIFLTFSFRSF